MKTFSMIFALSVTICSADNRNCPVTLHRTRHLQQFGRSCYEFNLGEISHKSWHDSTADCLTKGGHLVDIHSKAEQEFIISTSKALRDPISDVNKIWIALNNALAQGNWTWFTERKEIDFQNWASDQPDNDGDQCALMKLSGEWYVYACDELNGWICEFPSTKNFDCPTNLLRTHYLLQWRDSCYLFSVDFLEDWSHADNICLSKGGYLVDIHSQEEQDFLFMTWANLRSEPSSVIGLWIGLTDGQSYYEEGKWNWTSHSTELDYENWYPGQPNSPGDLEDCALMKWSDAGKWHDYPCTQVKIGFICEFRRNITN